MPLSETFTCITCRMTFSTLEEQRAHYRTAWHCYNLKRKVRGLPPVTRAVFEEKVEQITTVKKPTPDREGGKNTRHRGKKNKLAEKRRLAAERAAARAANASKAQEKKSTADDVSSDASSPSPSSTSSSAPSHSSGDLPSYGAIDGETADALKESTVDDIIEERLRTASPIPPTECLFSKHHSTSVQSNVNYMAKTYGFFIPDREYLKDLDGFISYLGEKVGIGYTCLWCGKSFMSLAAVQRHMIDAAHCKVRFYGHESEYARFYEWPEEMIEREGDEDEEDILKRPRVADNGLEVILPNGSIIGHRAMLVYYKQKHRGIKVYNPVWKAKVHKHNEMDKASLHRQKDQYMRLGVKANKLQKHFRQQTPM